MHSGNSDVKMPKTLNNTHVFNSINKIFIDYALLGSEVSRVVTVLD